MQYFFVIDLYYYGKNYLVCILIYPYTNILNVTADFLSIMNEKVSCPKDEEGFEKNN